MKFSSLFLVIVVLFCIIHSECFALPVTIGRDGIIVVIDGRLYYLKGKENEYIKWAQRKLPPLRETDEFSLVTDIAINNNVPGHEREIYLTIGSKFLSADETGHIIKVKTLSAHSRWFVKETGGWQTGGGDSITEYEFTNADPPGEDKYIGLGEKPLYLTDKEGKEHAFYPLILTTSGKSVRFLINDYSGK